MKKNMLYIGLVAALLCAGCAKDKDGSQGKDQLQAAGSTSVETGTQESEVVTNDSEAVDVKETKEEAETAIREDASYAEDRFAMAYAAYEDYCKENEIESMALIRLDGDACYDLLYLKDSAYHVVTFGAGGVEEVVLTPNGQSVYAFGQENGYFNERHWDNPFYEFEYVEGRNLIRYHEETSERTRIDHYINVGTLEEELCAEIKYEECLDDAGEEVGSQMYMVMKKGDMEISYDEFYEELGSFMYRKLQPAIVAFSSVSDAYLHAEEMKEGVDEAAIYEAFMNNEIEARKWVEKKSDCYDEIFLYEGFVSDEDEEVWYDYEYDFNEDGIKDLFVSGFCRRELYTVMDGELILVCDGNGTADVLDFYTHNGDFYATTSDTTHGGRQMWSFRRFDGCFRAIDMFDLNALYWEYIDFPENEECDCFYRGERITKDEFIKLIAEWTDYEE